MVVALLSVLVALTAALVCAVVGLKVPRLTHLRYFSLEADWRCGVVNCKTQSSFI